MASNHGLLERICELKQTYGIGSDRALKYVRLEEDYLQLSRIMQSQLGSAVKLPDWHKLYDLTYRFVSMSLSCKVASALSGLILSDDAETHARVLRARETGLQPYHAADDSGKRTHERILTSYFTSKSKKEFAHFVKRELGLGDSLAHILSDLETLEEDSAFGEREQFLYGNDSCVNNERVFTSAYMRGVIEQTLHRLDVQRLIAYQTIAMRAPQGAPRERIELVLSFLQEDIAESTKRYKSETPSVAKLIAEVFEVEDPDLLEEPELKKSYELAYPILRGNATKSNELDFQFRKAQYTQRAIFDNMKWLHSVLE